jgi:peptidoglycan hydrolase-like protein with peptidoglycan-binding domain
MTHYVDGVAALALFQHYSNLTPDHCLEYSWDAYHAEGAQSSVNYGTAGDAFRASPGLHAGDYNPPAGDPVWFGPDPGDVGISSGNGNMWGVWDTGVRETSIRQRETDIGRHYEGWSEGFMTDNIIVPGVGRNVTVRPTTDVQTKLEEEYHAGIASDGVYGPMTTYFVRRYQGEHGLTVDGIYGPHTDAAMFPNILPPGVHALGADASTDRPSPEAVLAVGRSFVVVYVGAFDGDNRAVTKAEVDNYLAKGVDVAFVYEGSGKDAINFQNGVGDAQYAQGRLAALGFPDAVIRFAVDEQFAPDPVDYFKGVESVLGHGRTSAYGSLDTLQALQSAGLGVDPWLTYGWLQGRPVPSYVVLEQYLNGQTIDGHQVDYDQTFADDFGQVRSQNPQPQPHPQPQPPQPQPTDLLTEDGILGPKTISRWQQVMGTPVDGVISTPRSALVVAVQEHLNAAGCRDQNGAVLVVDGIGIFQNNQRYRTAYALQRYMGTPLDGILSLPVSTVVRAVQHRLNENTF